MRRSLLPLSLLILTAPVYASAGSGQAIALENQKATAQSVSGSCGPAAIQIRDSESGKDSPWTSTGFSGSYTAISIQSGKSVLKISPGPENVSGIFLQDRNKLHCVNTPSGPKLILAMFCYARACAPVDYRVIDPKTAKVINKLDNMEECDALCAQKALGVQLPANLTQ